MDFFQQLLDKIATSIDLIIVGIVFAAGFFQGQYLEGWRVAKSDKQNGALKTLLVSFAACAIYTFLAKDEANGANWAKYFLSFFLATSAYELGIKHLMDWIGSKLPNKTTT